MTESTKPITGAQSLVHSLEAVGADVVFGIPGGAILPAYDPLFDSTAVRHVLVRHEQPRPQTRSTRWPSPGGERSSIYSPAESGP